MTLTQHSDQIWTLEGCLTHEACGQLIQMSEARGYEEAAVSLPQGVQMMKGLRNNYRLIFEDLKYAQTLFATFRPLLPPVDPAWLPVRLNETFRFYRYDENQRFKRHIDGRIKAHGLESRLTFMVYLNSDFEGGATKFDEVTITPKTGTALLFVHEQKHESLPIKSGTKYVLRSDVLYRDTLSEQHI